MFGGLMVRVGLIGDKTVKVEAPKPTVEKTYEKKVEKPTDNKVRKTK